MRAVMGGRSASAEERDAQGGASRAAKDAEKKAQIGGGEMRAAATGKIAGTSGRNDSDCKGIDSESEAGESGTGGRGETRIGKGGERMRRTGKDRARNQPRN